MLPNVSSSTLAGQVHLTLAVGPRSGGRQWQKAKRLLPQWYIMMVNRALSVALENCSLYLLVAHIALKRSQSLSI